MDQGEFKGDTFVEPKTNIVGALNGITNWFNKVGDYQNDFYVQTIVKDQLGVKSEDNQYSTALRLLMHYVGDSHQPLHMEARVDPEFPKGDKGGNDFPLPNKYPSKYPNELHAVWDSVIYEMHDFNFWTPFTDSDWEKQGLLASSLMQKYPQDSIPDVANLDPAFWAQESFELAKEYVYNHGAKENVALPEGYVDAARPIAERRVVTAGYRMASLLETLDLSTTTEKETKFLQ